MQSARIAFRNIARQKKRTVLLGGAIAFGVLTIILMGSFTAGVLSQVSENFTGIFGGHIYVSGQELSATGKILARVGDREILEQAITVMQADIASLHFRSRANGFVIFGSKQERVRIEGVNWAAETGLWDDLGVARGNPSMLARENAIVLPGSVAASLGVEVGEAVLFRLSTITGQANVGEFTLAGVYPDNQSFNISGGYTGLTYLNVLLGLGQNEYQFLNITLQDIEQLDALADKLYGELGRLGRVQSRGGDDEDAGHQSIISLMWGNVSAFLAEDEETWQGTQFAVATLNDIMDAILSLVQIIDLIRIGLFAVLLLITMVGLLNTFRMVLIERTQEIGTLRAIGMQRAGVRNTFLLEALFLALVGALAGLLAALLIMAILGSIEFGAVEVLRLFTRNGRFVFPFVLQDAATTILVLGGVTVLSAWLPARKAARLRPADALRATY